MFQINNNTIICTCFLTDSIKKFIGSVFDALCCLFVYESTAQIQCPSNDIVIESKQSVKGNNRTKANIECAGKVADVVKLMAGEEVTLKAGFTSPPHLNLELNNEGCNFYSDDWTLVDLDDNKLRKIYLPKTYPYAGVQIGRDTWFFSAYRFDDQVNFNFEIGPGNPYVPSILKEPLPLTHKRYFHRQFIYSTFENGKLNGVFYYGDSDFDIRDTEGVYLHLTDTEFEEILFVDNSQSE